jgi:hypothetical protein
MSAPDQFQRVILGMLQHAPRQGLRQAVELASLLEAELRGVFVKDEELCGVAALPFAREFRPLEGGWHRIDSAELSNALDIAARSAERSFREAVKRFGQSCGFEVIQGRSFASAIASASRAGDILVVPEAASPIERATSQFQAIVKEAFDSPASVLLVPAGIVREKGAVVALASAPGDPSIEVASRIAARARETVSVVDWSKIATRISSPFKPGERVKLSTFQAQDPLWSAIVDALEPLRERLLIVSRHSFDDSIAELISTTRRIPVLVVEPKSGQE